MRIATAQFNSVMGDVEANIGTMRTLIHDAAGQGARLVVFAELAVTGYAMGPVAARPALWLDEDDSRLEPVRAACRGTGVAAVVNAVVRPGSAGGSGHSGHSGKGSGTAAGGRPGITSLVFGPAGELLSRYDKRNLHGVEKELFEAGTADGRFTLDGIRFALAVCYDNRFPEIAGRARADGCQVYLASSVLEEGNDSFETVYPVRARENGLVVALANHLGPSDAGDCPGESAIWGADGAMLATAGRKDPGLAVAELSLTS
ncbi:carbon-nitrogen hydrolase family protein [Streptomyces sp. CAU 1734]|uniref:carbon-nitrogen hydrolase family protein n=1 Tax=Streptomyces sp. CAU 1734 TaxID=3140360 RepID=UPI0032604C9C